MQAAKKEGVDIRVESKVSKADSSFEARVQLADGQWVEGEVITTAEGIKSDLRRQIAEHHGHKDHSTPTGDAAYRILIPKDKLHYNQYALSLLDQNVGIRWIGPGGHIMAYLIKNNTRL